MDQVRYTQRDCTDKEKIENFLLQERTGVLGMVNGNFPYAVPINYVWHKGSVYFHGMGSGKKEDILSQSPPVCFTIYQEHGTVIDPVPCHADTAYMSVMLFGNAEKVTDFEEAAEALQILVDKYMPEYYNNSLTSNFIEKYRSSLDENPVSVYKIVLQGMTAKENSVESEKLFKSEIH
jgi:Predicted flavin-nucleotide-binding protein